jgi:hypothetical protein
LRGDGVRDLIGSADLQDIFSISMSLDRSDFWRIINLLIHKFFLMLTADCPDNTVEELLDCEPEQPSGQRKSARKTKPQSLSLSPLS